MEIVIFTQNDRKLAKKAEPNLLCSIFIIFQAYFLVKTEMKLQFDYEINSCSIFTDFNILHDDSDYIDNELVGEVYYVQDMEGGQYCYYQYDYKNYSIFERMITTVTGGDSNLDELLWRETRYARINLSNNEIENCSKEEMDRIIEM